MRVVINGLAAMKPKTGVGQYIAHLYSELQRQSGLEKPCLFPGDRVRSWAGTTPKHGSHKPSSGTRGSIRGRVGSAMKAAAKMAAAAHFAAYTRAFRFDLYHEPNFLPFHSHLPTVVTAHDLSVLKHPQWHPADRVRAHAKAFTAGIERAAHVIVGSETVRREVVHDLGVSDARVTRVYYGISSRYERRDPDASRPVLARLGLPARFFLCVGTIEPRKNLLTALQAFVDLPASVRQRCPLVLAGPWGWKSDGTREYFESKAGPAGAVHLGYVADEDLPSLYSATAALLFPTRYEGFGLPPVESLACGGRVIASNIPVVREALGRHAIFLDPDDIPGWRQAMTEHEAIPNPFDATAIRHARQFSWERTARETLAVYRKVLGLTIPATSPARAA